MSNAERADGAKGNTIMIVALVVVIAALIVVWLVDRRINPGLVLALGLLLALLLGSRRRTDGAGGS